MNRKRLNSSFVKTWFMAHIVLAFLIVCFLQILGVLKPFIEQVIIWPLTSFENPSFNFSFVFSFVWFPLSLLVITLLVHIYFYVSRVTKKKSTSFLFSFFVLCFFYSLYYLSMFDFAGSRTDTLKTFPGFIKTASVYFQHLPGLASATAVIIGFLFLYLKRSTRDNMIQSPQKSMEFGLMGSLGITGWIQLYPLHDNVHLWFVTPLFIVPAAYYWKESVKDFSIYVKPLALVFSMFLIVQSYSFYSYLSIDRVPLSSSELQGMMASTQYRDTTDKTMVLLNKYISERSLRNNCKASLFSVSNRKYQSIDGNFSDNFFGNLAKSTPIVDPSRDQPEYVFECGINDQRKQSIMTSGFETVFEVDLTTKSSNDVKLYNVLFRRVSTLIK
jgi:hypothetical protein